MAAGARRGLIAWGPVVCAMALAGLSMLPDGYHCVLIEPGGKEHMCGYHYAQPLIQFATETLIYTGAAAFLASLVFMGQGRLSRLGVIGCVLSALLAVVLLVGYIAFAGTTDDP